MKLKYLYIPILSASLLFSSCASSTIIDSSPSNATIFVNGEKVGKTPYEHKDTKIVGSTN